MPESNLGRKAERELDEGLAPHDKMILSKSLAPFCQGKATQAGDSCMMLADTNDMKESLQRETEQSETRNSLPECYETIYKVLQKQLS